MRRTRESVHSTYLFPAIVMMLIAQPVVASLFAAASELLALPLIATLVAMIWSIDGSGRWLRPGIALGSAAFASFLAGHMLGRSELEITSGALTALLGGLCVVLGVISLFRSSEITFSSLLVAMSVYLLMGAMFGLVFDLCHQVEPAWFHGVTPAGRAAVTAELIYFSLGTLTGTAYGDILPVQPIVRALTNVEAVVGQLYIAVLVARLVSSYVGERDEPNG
jgi:Ion channel